MVVDNVCFMVKSDEVGKLVFDVFVELFKDFFSLGFSCIRILEMLGVFCWIVLRRINDNGLED